MLAVDLDPQASLSALHGYQPEFDIGENETLYGAIRYDDQRRDLGEIVRPTYFSGLELVPANIEFMEFEHESPKASLRDSRATRCSSPVSLRRLRRSRAATMSSSSIARPSSGFSPSPRFARRLQC